MGVNDRVKKFLDSWPLVEKHLNELLEEAIRDGKRTEDGGKDNG